MADTETAPRMPDAIPHRNDPACVPRQAGEEPRPPAASHKSLALALLAAQMDAKEIIKDARNSGGPGQQAYDYATLPNVYAQARATINAHGLVLSHEARVREIAGEAWSVMETHVTHAKSGASKSTEYLLYRGWLPPKQAGALMTYAERYNTLALLALAAKERDGDGEPVRESAAPSPAAGAASIEAGARLMLIDASGLIYRAYHGCPALTRESDGRPVGAVVGFCAMLDKLTREAGARVGVVFDAGKQSFRHALYPDYKANRGPTPDDLASQMPLFRDAAAAMGFAVIEMAGFEADDLIATLARQAQRDGAQVTVVSSDKDLMQLIGDGIVLYDPKAERTIDRQAVIDKMGVGPERVTDALALIGDSADNVPGATGIGAIWAGELLSRFGTVEAMLARIDEVDAAKRDTIAAHANQILMSKRLVTLAFDAPLGRAWATLVRDAGADADAFLKSLGPHRDAEPETEAGPAQGESDAGFYASMMLRLARAKTPADLDDWLELCTMDALKRCSKTERDSLRAEHGRKRESLAVTALERAP